MLVYLFVSLFELIEELVRAMGLKFCIRIANVVSRKVFSLDRYGLL